MFIRDIAHNLFQEVFKRDYALESAMFVDDKAEVCLGLLHLPENILETGGVNYIDRWLQHIFEPESFGLQEIRHHVLTVNDTDYVIERLAVDRQPRIAMLLKSLRNLLQRAIARNRRHFRARYHCFPYQCV